MCDFLNAYCDRLCNEYLVCDSRAKVAVLLEFLRAHSDEKVIVYFLTCACVDYFRLILGLVIPQNSRQILTLHGQMVPKKRKGDLYSSFFFSSFSGKTGFF